MKPSQVASKLRQIATTIDKSQNPRQRLVIQDIKQINRMAVGPLENAPMELNKFVIEPQGPVGKDKFRWSIEVNGTTGGKGFTLKGISEASIDHDVKAKELLKGLKNVQFKIEGLEGWVIDQIPTDKLDEFLDRYRSGEYKEADWQYYDVLTGKGH